VTFKLLDWIASSRAGELNTRRLIPKKSQVKLVRTKDEKYFYVPPSRDLKRLAAVRDIPLLRAPRIEDRTLDIGVSPPSPISSCAMPSFFVNIAVIRARFRPCQLPLAYTPRVIISRTEGSSDALIALTKLSSWRFSAAELHSGYSRPNQGTDITGKQQPHGKRESPTKRVAQRAFRIELQAQ
jgi:hypothetical protein